MTHEPGVHEKDDESHRGAVVGFFDRHPINEKQILDALAARGIAADALDEDDLKEFDQDHYGGIEALEEPRIAQFTERDGWERKEEIGDAIAAVLATRDTAHWIKRMEPLKIWHARVQGYAEIAADPQVKHMECLVTGAGVGPMKAPVTLVNHPVRYDGQAAEMALPPRSTSRVTPPVRRLRWKRSESACRWRNTDSITMRELRAITRAKTICRISVNTRSDRRAAP